MGNFNNETKKKFSHLKDGDVILVENIRFFKEEKQRTMRPFQKK